MAVEGYIAGLAKRKKGAAARGEKSKDDEEKVAKEDGGDDYDEVEESALADMAEALGLEGKAADKFSAALSEYVEACVQRQMDEG